MVCRQSVNHSRHRYRISNMYTSWRNSPTKVKRAADILPTRSPKLSSPIASPPRKTVKLSHDRNVLSFAKNTFGSTLAGRAMRLPGAVCSSGRDDISIARVTGSFTEKYARYDKHAIRMILHALRAIEKRKKHDLPTNYK